MEIASKVKHSIKLACFDIDGTLIGSTGELSAAVRREVRRIQRQGVSTCVASGRPPYAAKYVIEELGLLAPGVFCAGALVFDPRQRRALTLQSVDAASVQAVLEAVRDAQLYCELYTEHYYVVEQISEIQQAHSRVLRVEPQLHNLRAIACNEPVIKLLLGAGDEASKARLRTIEQQFPQLHFAYAHMVSHPHWDFASVVSSNASKREAFKLLCDFHGISSADVISFGDAHSDVDFLQLAGIGVAMGNASDAVKAVADFTTAGVEQDGVALALREFIPIPAN